MFSIFSSKHRIYASYINNSTTMLVVYFLRATLFTTGYSEYLMNADLQILYALFIFVWQRKSILKGGYVTLLLVIGNVHAFFGS